MYDKILNAASGQWFLGQIQSHRVSSLTETHVEQLASFLNKPETKALFKIHLQNLSEGK